VALSTSCSGNGILASAHQTYLEKQSSLLGDLLLCGVCNRHCYKSLFFSVIFLFLSRKLAAPAGSLRDKSPSNFGALVFPSIGLKFQGISYLSKLTI
jgi:hypothetical protein